MRKKKVLSFGSDPVLGLLVRLSLPVMLSQLVLAFCTVGDSFFIGKYSGAGLTAISIVYPVQLLLTAAAAGTGVGVGNLMARYDGLGRGEQADTVGRCGTGLALWNWIAMAAVMNLFLTFYIPLSSQTEAVRETTQIYGSIICFGSLGMFLEGTWTKVLQARGNMTVPMAAQIVSSVTTVALDPVLIWGLGPVPALGVAGAALAAVSGQGAAALITGVAAFRGLPTSVELKENAGDIYRAAVPSLAMQSMFTVYITGLNLVLAKFSDAAVTTLGLYFKLQAFFIVPVLALQSCVIPVLSFNYAAGNWRRCRETVRTSLWMAVGCSALGVAALALIPGQLLSVFSPGEEVLAVGVPALRIIAPNFLPLTASLLMPLVFQGLKRGRESVITSSMRHIILYVPVAWLLSHLGLTYVWLAFPITESLTALTAFFLYRRVVRQEAQEE